MCDDILFAHAWFNDFFMDINGERFLKGGHYKVLS